MKLKEKIEEYKPYFIMILIILGLLTINIYTLTLINNNEEKEEEIVPMETKKTNNKKIKVDIKGEINAAGVYEIDENARVNDLIN